MTWNAFHNRGEILRAVVDAADARRDGMLPLYVAGVAENFRDELDLLSALQLRWHARLSGNIERELMQQPMDLESAVARAWRRTSDELPGIRLILDRYTEFPNGPEMATAMTRATEKEWIGLASAAGLANPGDTSSRAVRAGERVAERARSVRPLPTQRLEDSHETDTRSLVERIRAVLVA